MPHPTPAQLAWQDFELGLVFHFDLPVFTPQGWTALQGTLDPSLYDPQELDTDQWLEVAKAMGCRYAVFTATHFLGNYTYGKSTDVACSGYIEAEGCSAGRIIQMALKVIF